MNWEHAQRHVAAHYLGREPGPDDLRALAPVETALEFSQDFDPRKKDCLLLSACHAIQLRHYLRSRADFCRDYNIHVILAQVVDIRQLSSPMPEVMRRVFSNADVVLCNNFQGARIDALNVVHHPGKSTRRVVVFPPPSNTTWWPIFTESGPELKGPAKAGRTREEVWESFLAGTFDCCFEERVAVQKKWSVDRELDADIKLVPFVEHNFRDCKFWFTSNHPTYNLVAWIGSEFMRLMGYQSDSLSRVMGYPTDTLGTWNACPETKYEFDHYGLKYPMRWKDEIGGLGYYRSIIMKSGLWPKK